jgi:acetolactate synthase-1/2/3 large subunit
MMQVFAQLRDVLPDDAIITTDAGNFSGWCQRYLRYGRPNRLLAPLSGAMGYCVPSAVSASLQCPDQVVLGFCGDGGFMMTGMELATAMHHGAKPILMVCNNAMYGTIRMHQQRDFPERVSGTALTNPDFVSLAQSYGAFGARITHADQFADVWAQALAADCLALIEVQMDPRQITTGAKLG